MTLTAGVLSQVSVSSTTGNFVSTAASGGTGPYTQQWYRSTATGFSPGGGNILAGQTALTLADTGLIPNTQYFYKVVYTDTGASNVTITSTQLAVATSAPTLNPNQFAQSEYIGAVDQAYNYNTKSVQIDASQATPLFAGAAVKIVNSPGGVPKVVGCSANSDVVWGFLNFNFKNVNYPALSLAEVSMAGNVIYLYSTGVIARGSQVTLDLTTNGGVAQITTGSTIVGYAMDAATAPGQLIRIELNGPSRTVAP